MVTNHDIEIAFVRAQNRINEQINKAQMEFMLPDMERVTKSFSAVISKNSPKQVNLGNPIANEEI